MSHGEENCTTCPCPEDQLLCTCPCYGCKFDCYGCWCTPCQESDHEGTPV